MKDKDKNLTDDNYDDDYLDDYEEYEDDEYYDDDDYYEDEDEEEVENIPLKEDSPSNGSNGSNKDGEENPYYDDKSVDDGNEKFDKKMAHFSLPNLRDKHKKSGKNNRNQKKTPLYYILTFFKKLLALVGTTLVSIFLILVITGTVCVVAFVIYVLSFMDTTTDVNLTEYEMSYASYIYTVDSDGNEDLVYKVKASDGEQRIPITIDQIPQDVRNAFVYTEDERFYAHDGVDLKRTLGAFVNIFTNIYGSEQGGSTITQQLIKNITGDNETSSERKIREIFRAMQLEKKYPKDTILESYLNCIYFGRVDNNNLNGIEAASIAYFGKSTSELSIVEAACLAAIPKDPFLYNPIDNPEENKTRQEYVLSKMFENGVISPEQYEEALNEELIFTNSDEFKELYPDFKLFDEEEEIEYDEDGNPIESITPYYVDAAIYEVRDWIAEEEGISQEDALSKFNKGGYTLYLTIDLDMQAYVDEKYLDRDNFLTYAKNSEGEYVQSSFIAMDYDGNVLAMAGGIGEKETNLGFNRAVQAQRQVGSTMKPVAAYGCALYNDEITWSTLFQDKGFLVDGKDWPSNYSTYGNSLEWTYNYIYVYDALRRSVNTTPANIVNEMGLETVFDFSKNKLGLNLVSPEEAANGVGDMTYSSLAVGGLYGGTSIEDLVNAYMPYGNGGYFQDAHVISRIENSATGEVLLDNSDSSHKEQVIDEETAYVMNKLLRQVITSGTGTAANLSNKTVCGKTGTTSDFNDITFVGLTEDFVSGIWVGYDTPYGLSPSLSSAQIWKNVIGGYANSLDTDASYPECDTVIEAHFCTSTGLIATSRCPQSSEVGYYKSSNATYCGRH
ncbi:MAG: transglycosylase domain-containing protein [Ruminococcus sp.]|nr:transglycosylase domain-containing protein [Ruminococcus sp.]